jgi:hypothetical protein
MPSPGSRPPSDYRRYRRQTDRNLVIAAMTVLVVAGSGFVFLIFGPGAGISSLICLLVGAAAIGGLWLLLTLIERWVGD